MKLKDFLLISAILIFSLLIGTDILKHGLFVMHDDQHVARLFLFDKALKSGQLPPRWVDTLGFGFGYPLFIFYPPFVYMLGEIFHLVGFGFIDSIKLVFLASIFLSGLGMYIFARELFGRLAAFCASIAYLLVPYRALDIYVRGALAESFAFVWLPLILWSFYLIGKTKRHMFLILSSVFLTLLVITHNLIFLPFMIFLPLYLVFLVFLSKEKLALFFKYIFSLVLAAGLSAFFWLPSLLEKKYTLVDKLLLADLADYKIHFVHITQLWNWPWGYGGSAPGLADGISFKIGKLNILVSFFILALCSLYIILLKKIHKKIHHSVLFSLLFFSFFILAAFMTTAYSSPIWNSLKFLAYLQFPWRFLIFTSVFSSILMGALISFISPKIFKLATTTLIITLVIASNYKLFKPLYIRSNLKDQDMTTDKNIEWDVSKSSFEYAPKEFPLKRDPRGFNIPNLLEEDLPTEKALILAGNAQIVETRTSPSAYFLKVNSNTNSVLRLNTFYFPGWKVTVNGKETKINDNNELKLISINLPPGVDEVIAQFKDTLVVKIANYLSLISFLILIPLSFKLWPIRTRN